MKRYYVSITQRGQITLPAAIRKHWNLRARDRIVFEVDDGQVRVTRPPMTLEETFGSIKHKGGPVDFKKQSHEAWEAKIARDAEKMRDA